MSRARLEHEIRGELEKVELALVDAVANADPFVQEAATYLVAAGGKRFRPLLVLLTGHLGDPARADLVRAAAAIELTHLSTLYHDDVMDQAERRRGTRSANARFGDRVAILTGDYLFSRASRETALLGPQATLVLADAIGRLCEGQIREARPLRPDEDPVERYIGVLADKTGALIAAACRLGAELAGAPAAHTAAVERFGERIGIAFQLADDILDITGDGAASGKQPGADLREGIRTLPVLLLVQGGGPAADEVEEVLAHGADEAAIERALATLRASSALREATAVAEATVHAANLELEILPKGPTREALELVSERALHRAR